MNELIILTIIFIVLSIIGYYFFIKKAPNERFNLRDKKDNEFYDYNDQF